MRRTVLTVLAALVLVLGLGTAVLAQGDGSSVTRARLERSLPVVFANLYTERARIQGRADVTPASLEASAMCGKHGAEGLDVGPGGDWVCLMSWQDPEVPMPPEGYGKFELNVHSNDCYTVSGPSKLTGFLTMTGAGGKEVTNPVFEFDGCFDPASDTSATGVFFPSLLIVTSTTLTPDGQGEVGLQLNCGTGNHGCRGTIGAATGGTDLGTMPYDLAEETTTIVPVPTAVPAGAKEVTFTVDPDVGAAPTSPVTLQVQRP